MQPGILWLHPQFGFTDKVRFVYTKYMERVGLEVRNVIFANMHGRVPGIWMRKPKTKNTWICNEDKREEFFAQLDRLVEQAAAKVIVINDRAALGYITDKYTSLDLCRGSVYYYRGIPCIVLDEFGKSKAKKEGTWVALNDLGKVKRWYHDEQRAEPKFSYTVCRTRSDLAALLQFARKSFLAAHDIETWAGLITCDGFCFARRDGTLHAFVVPYINPTQDNGCHWQEESDEVAAHRVVAKVLADQRIAKVYQNGLYDSAYNIKYRRPQLRYFLDTIHMWHSIWPEAPKKLNFISSILLDYCRYWKDEAKGEKKATVDTVPKQVERLERYWRYNALDCYNTLLNCRALLAMLGKYDWALSNYHKEFADQVGPGLAMSMRGMLVDQSKQLSKHMQYIQEHEKNLYELRVMCDDMEFNPNSPHQFASLIYDVLGAQPVKTKGKHAATSSRSVDEKILKLLLHQHPVIKAFIEKVWATKKPAANAKKYGQMRLLNGRFMYQLSMSRTETWRYASNQHQFRVGTNAQNIPYPIRDMFIPDPGYFFLSVDYSQSDAWFIAYHSEEPQMIANMNDPRDTHCIHCEHFFQIPYDKVYAGHIAEEEWVEHSTKGVRQNTKRIVHGSNFRMAGFTLFMTMGRESAIGAAKALGHKDADKWSQRELVDLCTKFLESYHQMYPELAVWFDNSVEECAANGNRATNAFGYTRLFFGNIKDDNAVQRELSAFYGQSGTSGNINRAMRRIYYESNLEQEHDILMMLQVHDELLFQIPIEKFGMVNEVLTMMREPVTIKGRTFTVPIDAKVAFHWGRGMVKWHKDLRIEELYTEKERWEQKYVSAG